jgi:hypothetical protein
MTALASRSGRGASIVPTISVRPISNPAAGTATPVGGAWATGAPRRLANPLLIERSWSPDREAMVAALRLVLDLPRQLPDRGQGGDR